MPWTLFWLRSMHATWVAHNTHQTSSGSPLTIKHPSCHGEDVYPSVYEIQYQVSIGRMWELASRRCLLKIAFQPRAS
jgi:hypothetical protein